jgi:hypothetical protein
LFPVLQRIANSRRVQRALGAFAAAAICAVGSYLFGEAVNNHYPIREWLVWRLAPIWGYTLLFNASSLAFGSYLLKRLLGERELPALERLLQSMMLGLVGFVLCLYTVGFVGLFKPWMAVLIPLGFLTVGAKDGLALGRELVAWRASIPTPKLPERVLGSLAVVGGAAALVFLYLEALDVSAFNFDATWYHYPTAQDYARIGRIVAFPGEHHRAYPHLKSIVDTWGLLVPGLRHLPQHWMLSLHLEYSMVVWRIVGGATLARWLLGGRDVRGLWAAFFLFPSIFIYDQSIGGSADHYLGFFAAPALLAAARAMKAFDLRWCVLLGVALGGHMLVKYQAVFLVAGVGATVLVCLLVQVARRLLLQRRGQLTWQSAGFRPLFLAAGSIIIAMLLVSAPHFGKNVVFYKNPTYPFAQKIFKSSWPKAPPGYYQERSGSGVFSPKGSGLTRQLTALRRIYDYSFKTANRNLTNRRPYMGALFSLLLPCALLVPQRKRLLFTAGVLGVAFMVWGNTALNDRYLLSFYDLCIGMALALMVAVWDLGWLARVGLVPLVALQLVWGGDAMLFYGKKSLQAALDLIGTGYAGNYDELRFEREQPAQRQITLATPKTAVIVARNYKGLLGLDRTVLSDIHAATNYVSYSGLKDARDFYDMLAARGVTHLMYPPGQRKPARWNNIVLWDELFRHYTEHSKRYSRLQLAELPKVPPPHDKPYLVLVSGLREYPDGVYAVEQLDVDSKAPELFSPKPRPRRKLTADNVAGQLADVSALAFGRGRLPRLLNRELIADFQSVERLDGDELYLRERPATVAPSLGTGSPSPEAEPSPAAPTPSPAADDDDMDQ